MTQVMRAYTYTVKPFEPTRAKQKTKKYKLRYLWVKRRDIMSWKIGFQFFILTTNLSLNVFKGFFSGTRPVRGVIFKKNGLFGQPSASWGFTHSTAPYQNWFSGFASAFVLKNRFPKVGGFPLRDTTKNWWPQNFGRSKVPAGLPLAFTMDCCSMLWLSRTKISCRGKNG